jgi:hypothetical protein
VQGHVDDEDGSGEHPGDLDQQHRELTQADLEFGLGLPFTEPESDPPEFRPPTGGDHHAGAGTGVHHRAHQRAAAQLSQRRPGRNRAGGLVSGQRLTGQDRFLALQPRGGEQPQVSRHHLAQLQVDHVAGHKLGDVN